MTCSMAGHAQDLSIAMTGDVMMGTTFPSIMLPAHEGRDLFKDAKDILSAADLTVGNLEGAICDGGTSTKGIGPNSYAFRTPTSYGHLLREAGFDFMSMANNHANDFGLEGIESTENVLKSQGILFSGIDGRVESAVIERNGLTIGLCAFGHNSYTIKHLDLTTVGRIVDDLVRRCDLVIVSFHGGAEGKSRRRLPFGPETFLGIAYSLGNFCTPYNVNLTGISGYAPIVEITVDKEGAFKHGKIYSFIQTRGIGPRTDKTKSVAHEMKNLSEIDLPQSQAVIDLNGNIELKK